MDRREIKSDKLGIITNAFLDDRSDQMVRPRRRRIIMTPLVEIVAAPQRGGGVVKGREAYFDTTTCPAHFRMDDKY